MAKARSLADPDYLMKRRGFEVKTNKMKLVASLTILAMLFMFGSAQAKDPTFVLKFCTVSVPNDTHTRAMYVFKDEVEKLTNGQVKVEVYHSGQLQTQEGMLPACMRGTVEMALLGAGWMSDQVLYLSMFMAGYMFRSYEHMNKVLNGPIGREVFDDIAKRLGVRPLGSWYLGARQLNLRDVGKEVRRPEDLKGIKLRMPNSPSYMFLGKALGANPTPLNFNEVYMALKTGAIDAQDNPLPTNKNAKFYEVTKYIVLTNHLVDSVWPTINEKVWQKMDPDLQAKLYEACEKARAFCDKTNLEAEAELVEFFKEQGLKVIIPDVEAFAEHVQKAYLENKELTATWDMDLYRKVQAAAK